MSHTQHGCLTVPEAAHYLKVSERYLRTLIAESRIAYYRLGSRIVFTEDQLLDFLSTKSVPARVRSLGRTA
jgi:excisionase family DNA binding protein